MLNGEWSVAVFCSRTENREIRAEELCQVGLSSFTCLIREEQIPMSDISSNYVYSSGPLRNVHTK